MVFIKKATSCELIEKKEPPLSKSKNRSNKETFLLIWNQKKIFIAESLKHHKTGELNQKVRALFNSTIMLPSSVKVTSLYNIAQSENNYVIVYLFTLADLPVT